MRPKHAEEPCLSQRNKARQTFRHRVELAMTGGFDPNESSSVIPVEDKVRI